MEINFNTTKEDCEVIVQIAERAAKTLDLAMMDTMMDITAVHLNDTPLRLNDLLNADKFNFNHDVLGIVRTLNRNTGKLTQCFLPRFKQ